MRGNCFFFGVFVFWLKLLSKEFPHLISTAPSKEFLPESARCHTMDIVSRLTSMAYTQPIDLLYLDPCLGFQRYTHIHVTIPNPATEKYFTEFLKSM
jgi:hypothetical protein